MDGVKIKGFTAARSRERERDCSHELQCSTTHSSLVEVELLVLGVGAGADHGGGARPTTAIAAIHVRRAQSLEIEIYRELYRRSSSSLVKVRTRTYQNACHNLRERERESRDRYIDDSVCTGMQQGHG